MATPAQAAAATVGAGSLAAAGAYGITQAVNGSGEETTTEEQESPADPKIPTAVTFTSSDLTNYTGKTLSFLKDDHLTKLVKATDENNDWWKWAYENRYLTRGNFTLEATTFNVTDFSSLKSSCNAAYEKAKTHFNTDNFLESVGAFCTTEKLSSLEPKATVYKSSDAATGYENGLLGVAENKDKLIKQKAPTNETTNFNDLWWNWALKNIYKKQTEEKSTTFQNLTLGYKADDESGTITSLNNACNEAYKKGYSDLKNTEWKLLKEIKKFCSINGEQTVLVLPEPVNPTVLTTSDDSSYTVSDSLYKQTDNPGKLIKPVLEGNQNWWEWSFNKNYLKYEKTKSELPKPFKQVNKSYDSTTTSPTEDNPLALNKACQKSYSETKTNLGDKSDAKSLINFIKELCTKGSNQDLTLPA